MDVEPIYCAEQIVVPVDLADVLKAFTKEVIRRQPEDLVDFGAKYFANLAQASKSSEDAPVPTVDQLKLVLKRADGAETLSQDEMEALSNQAGIANSVFAKVIAAGNFEAAGAVSVDKFLFLLLAMTCDSFAAVTAGIFELFGSELPSAKFVELIGYLAPDMDPEVTTQFLADLSSSLIDEQTVDYAKVASLDCLAAKLSS
mmetsp:Transcript_31978/g.68954  ORF Transcript_31978/g.68954 Transcript_31978/m.68954 type:complete len:201 (-) Transcript_31978:316-918(-)